MPLVDSFLVDHTIMTGPSVRLAKSMQTAHGDPIEVWDLRFVSPNSQMLPAKGIHTLEHLFADFMREHLNSSEVCIIDISPMGCRTGFYMSLTGHAQSCKVRRAFIDSMYDIVNVPDDLKIPAANVYQCGSAQFHSLFEAKQIANNVLACEVKIIDSKDIALSCDKLKTL